MFNNNKKNSKVGNTFADGFGRTENFESSSSFGSFGNAPASPGMTEPLPGGGALHFEGNLGPTMPSTDALKDNSVFHHRVDNFGKTEAANVIVNTGGESVLPVVGWLVCIKGSNIGKEFRIHSDYNYLGSSSGDIVIPGDKKISREKHMIITYDPMDRKFYVATASGANIIRLNNKALVGGGAELNNYDVISTGDSSFMFIGFCGEKFGWDDVK